MLTTHLRCLITPITPRAELVVPCCTLLVFTFPLLAHPRHATPRGAFPPMLNFVSPGHLCTQRVQSGREEPHCSARVCGRQVRGERQLANKVWRVLCVLCVHVRRGEEEAWGLEWGEGRLLVVVNSLQ